MAKYFTASQKVLILTVVFFISIYLISENSHPFVGCNKKDENAFEKQTVKQPDFSSIPDTEEGKMIKYGMNIITETYKYIGPDVNDTSMRYLATNMDCQNCHYYRGAQVHVLSLVGAYKKYPKFEARLNAAETIGERINNCMTRSMNGKKLPEDGKEMKSIVAYLKWLGQFTLTGDTIKQQGLPKLPLLERAADTSKGRIVFLNNCMTCHAEDGSGALNKPSKPGVPADSLRGYDIPPVWGVHSFNDGAGMYRLLTAASFIKAKMPLHHVDLTIEQAYDVAAFINSMPRPKKSDLDKDYPDVKLKPVDFPFPPFPDAFSIVQHKYGPYQQMMKEF